MAKECLEGQWEVVEIESFETRPRPSKVSNHRFSCHVFNGPKSDQGTVKTSKTEHTVTASMLEGGGSTYCDSVLRLIGNASRSVCPIPEVGGEDAYKMNIL